MFLPRSMPQQVARRPKAPRGRRHSPAYAHRRPEKLARRAERSPEPSLRHTASLGRRRVLLQVVGQFVHLVRRDPQSLGGLLPHGRHHFVVQVLDEFRCLLLDPLRRLAYLLAHPRGCVLDLAIEIVHKSSNLDTRIPAYPVPSLFRAHTTRSIETPHTYQPSQKNTTTRVARTLLSEHRRYPRSRRLWRPDCS